MSTASLVSRLDAALPGDHTYKEDAVREEIVYPLLVRLGYASSADCQIIRSRSLSHPFVMIGTHKRHINIIPDYILSVAGANAWVLDAKAPNENILSGKHIEQAYSYAIHPEIRANLFALCNGKAFSLFEVESKDPLLYFQMMELESHWHSLHGCLGVQAFRKKRGRSAPESPVQQVPTNYLSATPPSEITRFQKQAAKRHHGVHGYFTRQVWSVVQKYIETFTRKGDVVLDPFGGSGVTLIESLILGRKAIQIDINPLSKFIGMCHLTYPS